MVQNHNKNEYNVLKSSKWTGDGFGWSGGKCQTFIQSVKNFKVELESVMFGRISIELFQKFESADIEFAYQKLPTLFKQIGESIEIGFQQYFDFKYFCGIEFLGKSSGLWRKRKRF